MVKYIVVHITLLRAVGHWAAAELGGWHEVSWDARIVKGSDNFCEVRLGVRVRRGDKRVAKDIDVKQFLQFQSTHDSRLSLGDEVEHPASLYHPSIAMRYDWFRTEVHADACMELVEAAGLLQSIFVGGRVAELQVRQWFGQVCELQRVVLDGRAVLRLHGTHGGWITLAEHPRGRARRGAADAPALRAGVRGLGLTALRGCRAPSRQPGSECGRCNACAYCGHVQFVAVVPGCPIWVIVVMCCGGAVSARAIG